MLHKLFSNHEMGKTVNGSKINLYVCLNQYVVIDSIKSLVGR